MPHLVQMELRCSLQTHPQLKSIVQNWLAQQLQKQSVALHAWRIDDQYIRLLLTPSAPSTIATMVQSLGRQLALIQNQGQVFRGRYRCCIAQPQRWLLPLMVWLESYAVTASSEQQSLFWPWASTAEHAGYQSQTQLALSDVDDYWRLGNTPFERQMAYRQLLDEGLSPQQIARIQAALRGQWVLGEAAYIDALQQHTKRPLAPRKRGRPPKCGNA
ncbi:hypothetical protein [Brackiella oedipodis]|uniref:hypothetical protein n=1 Tax=Brackiella oedipodis TaxID=124225 RepID=UPI0012EC1743|nr:hypothetical protein [Brackiella oedipodis]